MSTSYYSSYLYPTTPPPSYNDDHIYVPRGTSRSHSRASSHSSSHSYGSSQDSIKTTLTTPIKSPIRQHGPLLLPKIRSQDQDIEPILVSPKRVRRGPLSSTTNPPASASAFYGSRRPTHARSLSTPTGMCAPLTSPIAPTRLSHSRTSSTLCSPISLTSSRNSSSLVDEHLLGKYAFPTYRQMPTYNPPTAYASPPSSFHNTTTYTSPISTPLPVTREQVLPTDLQYERHTTTTTLIDYLTASNPTPNLVRQISLSMNRSRDNGNTHFWWDIRNLRTWKDFTLSTIDTIPGLTALLTIEVPSTALPTPALTRASLNPETESNLMDLINTFYASKTNAALKVAQGQPHMFLTPCTRSSRSAGQPDFTATYAHDIARTLSGVGKGRVVGLVKSFNNWNTGMRAESPHKQVEYLKGLAHLHRVMREHGTRYGFIITEIELVCVRAVVDPRDAVPVFGSLELAPAIQLNASGPGKLTACLALWYLHMLAKEVPLPGQQGFRMDTGAPAALTRQRTGGEKDQWIPEPQLSEKREAKRVRGWVFPREGLSRKEVGKRWHK